jgi:hypothetical protein
MQQNIYQHQESVKSRSTSGMESAASSPVSQIDQSLNSGGSASIVNAPLDASSRIHSDLNGATSNAGNTISLFQRQHEAMDRGDLEMLLRIESIRNAQLQAQTRFAQDDNLSSNISSNSFNDLSTNILQQFAKQQQQNLLANQLHQLQQPHLHQHMLDSARWQQPYTGIIGNYGSTTGLAAGTSISNVMEHPQISQAPQNNEREQLLAALLSNFNDNFLLLQQSNFASSAENTAQFFSSTNIPFNALLDRGYQSPYIQHQHMSMFPGGNILHFATEMQTTGISSGVPQNTSNDAVTSDRKRDADEQAPVRALSAYNFFFRYERERILNSNADKIEAQPDLSQEKQNELLASHWGRDRTVKRRHRKSHGKISFAELSKRISQRWKDLPDE